MLADLALGHGAAGGGARVDHRVRFATGRKSAERNPPLPSDWVRSPRSEGRLNPLQGDAVKPLGSVESALDAGHHPTDHYHQPDDAENEP